MCADYSSDLYDYRSDNERRTMGSAEFMLRGELRSGSVRHEVTAALLRAEYDERFDPTQVYDWVGQINALRPASLTPNASPWTSPNTNRSLRSTEL
jgi:iron complex outermembrane receptor protein